ncbi:NHL repeat-containing protein [Actinoplanes sp. RD1]|uniref:hypothetical protein n=1 Tax=Actinoplanes sp. RD1 TaxID=3064538 RepID=UPI0027417FB4|nr:hypothetical protein [Actinoplanes sp. RD1]
MTYRSKILALVVVLTGTLATPAEAAPAESSDSVPGFNGTVLTVAYSGGTIFVGGDFTAAIVQGRSIRRTRLAAVNAYTGELLPWAPAADGRVKALAVSGSAVYLGGDFGSVNGQRRDSLARVDAGSGALSGTFRHSVDGRPYALVAAHGRLYAGGSFTAIDGRARSRLAAFDLDSGELDGNWRPRADDQVETLAAAGGRIYAGGTFHRINGSTGYDRLVALHPAAATIVSGFRPRASVVVFGIAATPDGVFTAGGGRGGTASAYSPSGSRRWTATFDGDAQAIATLGGSVYVGGHFDNACRTARTGDRGVCLDGSDRRVKIASLSAADGHLHDWRADANGIEGVLTMAASAGVGAFAAGGTFTAVDGRSQQRLAQFS